MKSFTFVLIILLLGACAPKTQAVTQPQAKKLEKGETLIINTTLNLFTFPRSIVYDMRQNEKQTTYTFYTPLMFDSVWSNYHFQLTGNGWTQETLRKHDNDAEALYTRQGSRLSVRLKLEGDRYSFETR
jgi:hypothetical protein